MRSEHDGNAWANPCPRSCSIQHFCSKLKKMGVLLEGQATDCIQSKLQIKPHNAVKVISKIIGSIPIYVANL